MKKLRTDPEALDFAKRQRRDMSDAEQILWGQLRGRRLERLKFRRQVPMGGYVADFLCESAKLIVEVDGWQHGDKLAKDERRDADLRAMGYRTLRVGTTDVRYRLPDVLGRIREACG